MPAFNAHQTLEVTASVTEPACTRAYRDNDRLRGCEPVLDGFRDESKKTALVLRRLSDGALQKLMDYISRRLQKQNDPADVATRILIVALAVSSAFGGTINKYLQRDCKERMKQFDKSVIYDGVLLGKFMGGRPVGQKMHGAGISRHRALAMKVICEDLQVCKLSLQRALDGGLKRDYNVVDVGGNKYVIDLMLEPGALYPWKAFKACAYIDGIQEVKEEPSSPEQRTTRGAKFMAEGGSQDLLDYLRSDSSDTEVARPSWHVDSHSVQRQSPEPVASGGFGMVFRSDYLGKPVAEKRLALKGRAIDSQHILDFVVEVALMRNLRHPNVLDCIGGCVTLDVRPRTMLLLTPWMPNGSLREAIVHEKVKKPHHFPLSQGMARGLGYLHSRGIVHCDFKSLNVLLDQDMAPCIGDFGMARLEGLMEQRIDSGACNGTPVWEAPEQIKRRHGKLDLGNVPASWRDVEVTHKADVYAFGLVVWEMHNQTIPTLTPRQKLHGELPLLPEGASWAAVVSSCCAGPPENRPDMEKVVHDLCESERAVLKERVRKSESEKAFLKEKLAMLNSQLKQERQKNKDLFAKACQTQQQPQPQHVGDQVPMDGLADRKSYQSRSDLVQLDSTPPKVRQHILYDIHRLAEADVQRSSIKRSAPQAQTNLSRHSKRPKVDVVMPVLDPAIIAAMEVVDCNDTKPQSTKACSEECGFGRNRICSIRKNSTHTSYIMLIQGSNSRTRQQLCQLVDRQCNGHSMPWINFILTQTILRKLNREQVLALRQKIVKKFEAEGSLLQVG